MDLPSFIFILALCLVLLRWALATLLIVLNQKHVLAHRDSLPAPLADVMDAPTYARSVDYTLAKSRMGLVEEAWSTGILVILLLLQALPASFQWLTGAWHDGTVAQAAWILAVLGTLGLLSLPIDAWNQFGLEERFGFNTTRISTWVTDRLKGTALAGALGFPLVWGVLQWVGTLGSSWWWAAWLTLTGFQLALVALAPTFILPLFNKFTPLEEGPLRDRLLRLGQETGFNARTILVADGSRRSRHANAYFTGFGRFRKIVLFDTLLQQLSADEIEAVLAHEIGHYRLRHIPRLMTLQVILSFLGFGLMGLLSMNPHFIVAFGFPPDAGVGPVLLLFLLLGGSLTMWISPLINGLSRRYEYEADAYARRAVGSPSALRAALRKLSEKNLSNLTPHPLYSAFHYSHPVLAEREAALLRPETP